MMDTRKISIYNGLLNLMNWALGVVGAIENYDQGPVPTNAPTI